MNKIRAILYYYKLRISISGEEGEIQKKKN